jgi:hypothetical protein
MLALTWPKAFDLPNPTEAMRPVPPNAPEPLRKDVQEKIENTQYFYDRFKSDFQPYVDKEGALVLAEFAVPDEPPRR